MSDVAEQQIVFDRPLVKARRRRYGPDAPTFLHAFALREMAERMAGITREFDVLCVLNAVPGLPEAIRASGHEGKLFTMDAAPELLRSATGLEFVGDDELPPLADSSVGCILSVLSLQLVNDLPGSLIQIRRSLVDDGLFLGVVLGGDSLREVRQAFLQAEAELASGASPRVAPFPSVRELGSLLQRAGFALPVVDADRIVVRYDDFMSLLDELRRLGWANPLLRRARTFLRRDVLSRAGELYHERFSDADGRIRATFELIWLTGWSPHESQRKPLRPGSATTRLADALGTSERRLPSTGDPGSND